MGWFVIIRRLSLPRSTNVSWILEGDLLYSSRSYLSFSRSLSLPARASIEINMADLTLSSVSLDATYIWSSFYQPSAPLPNKLRWIGHIQLRSATTIICKQAALLSAICYNYTTIMITYFDYLNIWGWLRYLPLFTFSWKLKK